MGILDEAIREHLELKRSRGTASESELQRLEDEAFGPPTRPGEPDFPDTGEETLVASNGGEAETTVVKAAEPDSETELPAAVEEGLAALAEREAIEATEVPLEQEIPPGPEEEALAEPSPIVPPDEEGLPEPSPTIAPEEPAAEHVLPVEEPRDAAPDEEGLPEPSPTVAPEEPATEHVLPVEEQGDAVPEPSAETEPATPAAAPGSGFYDRAADSELDLDETELDLDEAEELEVSETPPLEDHLAQPEPPAPVAEPPAESESEEHPVIEEAPAEHEEPATGEEPAEGEDVLADTPEFLKDQPEDDELWFEQGEPRDFDFD